MYTFAEGTKHWEINMMGVIYYKISINNILILDEKVITFKSTVEILDQTLYGIIIDFS